jgi:hypothetical protein
MVGATNLPSWWGLHGTVTVVSVAVVLFCAVAGYLTHRFL